MRYYCSEFAPFTNIHAEQITELLRDNQDVTLVIVNDELTDGHIKMYFKLIQKELPQELPYQRISTSEISAFCTEHDCFGDWLIGQKHSLETLARVDTGYGYEQQEFKQTFIFDDISEAIAHYIITNEMFNIHQTMVLAFNNMSYARFQHSMRVAFFMRKLAAIHDVNDELAFFTGVLHDYAKEVPTEEQQIIMEKYFPMYVDAPMGAWHGFVGSYLIAQIYGDDFNEQDFFEAIEFHSIGMPQYSKLGIILFIADYCDYRRSIADKTKTVWEVAQTNLYEAAQLKIEQLAAYFATQNKTLYWTTENMLKWLKEIK